MLERVAKGGELDLIRMIHGRVRGGSAVRLGIGDDAAVLQPPLKHNVLVTTDFSLEGRHFQRNWHPPHSVGHRCLTRGLSDLAAMGANPLGAFLSLALPEGFTQTDGGKDWVKAFVDGLLELGHRFHTPLAGGDTAASPDNNILIDIVLVGSAPRGEELRRSGAKPGDGIYVTGALGGSAVELKSLASKPGRYQLAEADGTHPHLFPEPRLPQGAKLLQRRWATSAIDISDGLSTDLRHICDESKVGAVIDAALIPLHPLLKNAKSPLVAALHGGEDYELLFTASAETVIPDQIEGVPVTRIGEITDDSVVLLQRNGRKEVLKPAGWEHQI